MKSSNIKKYLSKYAEPESQRLDLKKFKQNQFENILVIPAYGESSYPVLAESSSLTVLVINEPDFSNNKNFKQLKQVNQNLIKKLKLQNPKNILAINKTGLHALPQKQGVGQARKIGCDIALKLISEKIIKSPFIHTTDADVKLPTDYFDRANNLNSKEIGALVYNFKHNLEELDSNHRAAMLAYENYLHSYVACLKECASPYAFHTVGSTLAFQAEAYAQVRGMPKKSAGEDFYILNKIA